MENLITSIEDTSEMHSAETTERNAFEDALNSLGKDDLERITRETFNEDERTVAQTLLRKLEIKEAAKKYETTEALSRAEDDKAADEVRRSLGL